MPALDVGQVVIVHGLVGTVSSVEAEGDVAVRFPGLGESARFVPAACELPGVAVERHADHDCWPLVSLPGVTWCRTCHAHW